MYFSRAHRRQGEVTVGNYTVSKQVSAEQPPIHHAEESLKTCSRISEAAEGSQDSHPVNLIILVILVIILVKRTNRL